MLPAVGSVALFVTGQFICKRLGCHIDCGSMQIHQTGWSEKLALLRVQVQFGTTLQPKQYLNLSHQRQNMLNTGTPSKYFIFNKKKANPIFANYFGPLKAVLRVDTQNKKAINSVKGEQKYSTHYQLGQRQEWPTAIKLSPL